MNLKSTILFFSMALFATMVALAGSREVTLLDEDWKFQKGERGSEQDLSFDDSRWQSVQVPHDWAALGPFDLNEDIQFVQVIEDGDKEAKLRTGRTGALPATGTGWYRKHLSLPGSLASKKIYLEFDGAMSHARVYLNGTFVGEWPYGYSSFSFDITPYVRLGKDNILAVRLENKPEMSRFYSGAGIYRPVRLVCVEPAHVVHWGTCITTPEVSAKQGKAQIKTTVNTPDAATGKIKLVTEIWDQKGKKVATASQEKPAGGQVLFDQLCTVKQPALWDTETPNLYKAVSNVYVNNTLSDTYETTFGFRTIRFDKDKGFFLNGKSMKFKGVCLHHDLGPLGAAVSLRATERQIEIMKEMGCNAIRTSHNPPSVELLDLCDRMGILVQVEAFDEWKSGKCVNGYNTLFDQWAEKDLIAMIHRDRNHPSVVMWSIGNEIREQGMRDGAKVAQFLTDIAHREDPTRPTTAGFNNHGSAVNNGLAAAVDLVGFNYKYFDYEKYHKSHPEFVLYGSETSSTVSSRGIYKFPLKDNKNPWHEDYQVSSYDYEYVPWGSVPDSEFAEQDDHEYLLGEFVWTGFDYLGEPTPYGQGSPSRSSYFGIVDLAGLKKDRFYLYQSQWINQPVLHLMPHWDWPERIGQVVPVQCYTNYPKVELFVNGVSKGIKEKNPAGKYTRYRMLWEDVIYHPGEIKVVAYDDKGIAKEEKVIKTTDRPYKIALTADRSTITADGKDLSFVTIDVTDKDGNLCPRATNMLFVKVSGNGKLKALCNGDAIDLTSFPSNYMRVFSGKMVAIIESDKTAGEINLQVSGERLQSGRLKIATVKN